MPPAQAARSRRVALLAVTALVVGLLSVVGGTLLPAPSASLDLPFLAIAAAFVALESSRVVITVSARDVRVSLSDAALVVGLATLDPWLVVVASLLGYAPAWLRRPQPLKLFFNGSVSVLHAGVAVLSHRLVLDGGAAASPRAWIASLIAVALATSVSLLAVSTVVSLASGRTRWYAGIRDAPTTVGLAVTMGCIGVLAVVVLTVHPWAALVFAAPVALFAWSYVGYQRLRQSKEGTDALYRFTRSLGATTGVHGAAPVVLREARALLHARAAELVVVLPQDGYLRLRLSEGSDVPESLPLDDPLEIPWCAGALGATVCVDPSDSGPAAQRVKDCAGHPAVLATPLLHEDAVEGALMVAGRPGPTGFTQDEQSLLEALANHAAVALWGARLVDRLQAEATRRQHEALHDRLTGLPNRRAFTLEVKAEAARARAGEGRFALAILDLDLFKEVNETLGHAVGDRLLRAVADRLRGVSPGPVARLGGDEFAVLLPHVGHASEARHALDRVLEAVRVPISLGEVKLATTASAGIVLAPQHGRTTGQLLRRADVALYTSKRRGTGPEVYRRQEDLSSRRRLDLLAELPHALEEGQIGVYYQPKAQTATREVVGVEALARWVSPVFGEVDPTEFVPLAEASGQLGPLTTFVLEEAVRQTAAWRADGLDLTVAVNISTRALLDTRFVGDVAACLERYGLPAESLTLEITEGSVMREVGRSLAVLDQLDELGVCLAVDDFGTGWSSLAYLKRLPVDEVKIDRSFVSGMARDPDDAAIVASIVQLAHELGLAVVAEGVEEAGTWDRLQRLGCDLVQGFLLHRAVPAAELEAWLGQRRLPSSTRLAPLGEDLERTPVRRLRGYETGS